ncbi:Protein phosphatase 2C 70 [Hibiscus syriacus]|uniref:Protein phosphatase 2C 70 n=1 Tax=Hibiscus syriacus TaxID=106335 RepID=A0A6A2Z113_HIBSY|nr:Protein phosphatase 2C 70 [Hibiscus syriacus]
MEEEMGSFFSTLHVDDVERPLVSDGANLTRDQINDLTRNYDLEGACYQNEALLRPPRSEGLVHKQRIPPASPHLAQGDGLVLDVISDPSEDILVGQTLKRPPATEHLVETVKLGRPENQSENSIQEFVLGATRDQRSCLSLEVSGPARGTRCSVQSNTSRLPLTLGRVSPSDLLLKDGEVSGKHAMITWTSNKLKWELVDMGSLNGTLLNSRPINHPDSGNIVIMFISSETRAVHYSHDISRILRFIFHPKMSVWLLLEWYDFGSYRCVKEEGSFPWKMFAIINGHFLALISSGCLVSVMGMVVLRLPNLRAS